MPRIFVSHSSRDNSIAGEMASWLRENGFAELFLDFDRHDGIPPGEDWEKRLYHEIDRATAVVLLLSEDWLKSQWCFAEFTQSRALGKAVLPVVILPGGEKFAIHSLQQVNLVKDREEGLARLLDRLRELALDGPAAFTLPPGRSPYPGLLSFEREDAAVFHGREVELRKAVEMLEQLRVRSGARVCLLHGDSGSGKSSLLKAGLLPQLGLLGGNWILTPSFRPGSRPHQELRAALSTVLDNSASHSSAIHDILDKPSPDTAETVLGALRQHTGRHQATILLAIDQFEELFTLPAPDEQALFLAILGALLDERHKTLAVVTLRSADLPRVAAQLEEAGLPQQEFLLRPFPLKSVPRIVRLPAKATGLGIDDELVHAIVRDAASSDMLPLVAFLLRDLYDRHAEERRLTLAHYELLGDAAKELSPLESCIRNAADTALSRSRPAPSVAELAALREAFVTGLVRPNGANSYVRRNLPAAEIPNGARRLCDALEKERLLIRRQDGSLEVAHEALFRVWPLLSGWLEEERDFHRDLARIDAALADWQAQTEDQREDALLTGLLLHRAEDWIGQHPGSFTGEHRHLIDDSIRLRAQHLARAEEAGLNACRVSVMEAEGRLAQGNFLDAAKVLDSTPSEARCWEWHYLRAQCDNSIRLYASSVDPDFDPYDDRMITRKELWWHADDSMLTSISRGSYGLTLTTWDSRTGKMLASWEVSGRLLGHRGEVGYSVTNGCLVVILGHPRGSKKLEAWDLTTGQLLHEWAVCEDARATLLAANGRLTLVLAEGRLEVWEPGSGRGHPDRWPLARWIGIWRMASSSDSRHVLIKGPYGIYVFDTTRRGAPLEFRILNTKVSACCLSPNGEMLAVGYAPLDSDGPEAIEPLGQTVIYSVATGQVLWTLEGPYQVAFALDFSPDARWLATRDNEGVHLLDLINRRMVRHELAANRETKAGDLRFTPNGRFLLLWESAGYIEVLSAADLKPVTKLSSTRGKVSSLFLCSPEGRYVLAHVGAGGEVVVWDLEMSMLFQKGNIAKDSVQGDDQRGDVERVPSNWAYLLGDSRYWRHYSQHHLLFYRQEPAAGDGGFHLHYRYGKLQLRRHGDDYPLWMVASNRDVRILRISPDHQTFAVGSSDEPAWLGKMEDGRTVNVLDGYADAALAFSSDGKRVATGSSSGEVIVWDVASGWNLGRFEAGSCVLNVELNAAGSRVIYWGEDYEAVLGEVDSGNTLLTIRNSLVTAASFTPDGRRIALGHDKGFVSILDAATGREIAVLTEFTDFGADACYLAFSADGRGLIAVAEDGQYLIWNSRSALERWQMQR